jgi:hypothetical protein
MVPLPNDDESDSGFDTQFDTRICVNVRRYEICEASAYFESMEVLAREL